MSARFWLAMLLGSMFVPGGLSSGQASNTTFTGSGTEVDILSDRPVIQRLRTCFMELPGRMQGGSLSDAFFNLRITDAAVENAITPAQSDARNSVNPYGRAKSIGHKEAADDGLRQAIEQVLYRVKPSGQGMYGGRNLAQRLNVSFDAGAARLEHANGKVAFRLLGYGYGQHLAIPMEAERTVTGNRIEYRRGDLTEWYQNEARGLEQGFTLAHRPGTAQRGAPLVIAMAVEGDLRPALTGTGNAVLLESGGKPILRYGGLRSWDARKREVPARLEVTGREIRLVVYDRNAEYPLVVDPFWTQEAELTAPDGASGDSFGFSVSASGDTAVVGAPIKPIGSTVRQGAVYVFVRSGTTWTLQQELTPSPSVFGQDFGTSVSVSGDTLLVGNPDEVDFSKGTLGAVYVFVRSGNTWAQQQKLPPPGTVAIDPQFGTTVAVSGDTALVGVPGAPISFMGAVYVFVRSGTTWTPQQKLTASDAAPNDMFGQSLSVSGDTAVVGAPLKNLAQGATYVFVRSGTTWTQQQKLTPSDAEANGWSVAVSGDTAVVGAPGSNGAQGAAYVFVRNGATWTQQQKLIASDGVTGDQFGWSVAVSGDIAVVGTSGKEAAYVFVRTGSTWTEEQKLTASDGVAGDQFGSSPFSLAVSGDRVVVGAHLKQIGLNDSQGAVYIFRRTSSGTPGFAITKSHVGNFTQGQVGAQYIITVTNTGGAATTGLVTVTDTLPAGLTATAINGAGWMCTQPGGPCTRSDALAAGLSYPAITLTLTVAGGAVATLTNTASVTGGGVTAATVANDATTINPALGGVPDFAITKSHVGNFTQGQVGAQYIITVTNTGGAATTGLVTVTDTLPAGLTATAINGAGWMCTQPGGPCTRNDGLAAGLSYPAITLTVTVAANTPVAVINTATVMGGAVTADADDTVIDPTVVLANNAFPDDAFQVRFVSNLNIGDSVVNLTNTGTLTLIGGLTTTGNLCVNVYTFDPSEELISCCSCLVTPNGLNSLSARNDLITNTLTPRVPDSVVIKLVATMPIGLSPTGTGGTCNPSSPNASPAGPGISGSLVPGMRAWGTTLHALPTTPSTYGVTETEFELSILNPAELSKLALFCGFIQANGSGFGICKSCRTGGLGGATK